MVDEWMTTSSCVSWKVCVRLAMLPWLTLTWHLMLTGFPLGTVLLGRIESRTVSMVYAVEPKSESANMLEAVKSPGRHVLFMLDQHQGLNQ